MVVYDSSWELRAGLPLGGIGAGKVELSNRGKLINLTIFNNWNKPLRAARGFHVFVLEEGGLGSFMETDVTVNGMENKGSRLLYDATYPFLRLRRVDDYKVELIMFSALIPGDLMNSSLPAFGMLVRNKSGRRIRVAVSLPNLVGTSMKGRINVEARKGIIFSTESRSELDPAYGNMSLISDDPLMVVPQYSINVDPKAVISSGKVKDSLEDERPWVYVEKGLRFSPPTGPARGMWDDYAGLIVRELEDEARFVISWYFNNPWIYYPYRHYYGNFFKDSYEVARHFMDMFDELYSKSASFCPNDASLPGWLGDAICNSAYILSTNTWLDERGRFSMFESPENFPVLGTIGGWTYEAGSIPILLNLPMLERSFLELLASHIDDEGYVPHDLGFWSLDNPIDGTTSPPRWKDLNPTFILLAYRYYIVTGDADLIAKLFPVIVKALNWEASRDKDGDGLPELEGSADTSFDVTSIEGIDSYTSTLYLESLYAAREIARILGKDEMVKYISVMVEKAERSIHKLFNGKYFDAWRGSPDAGDSLYLGQVAGMWWAAITGLPYYPDRESAASILRYICDINGRASTICTPNLARPSGEVVSISPQMGSSWPRLVMSLAVLGVEFDVPCILDLVKREWDTLVSKGMAWNHPSRISAATGVPDIYLDHYIGSPSIWSVALHRSLRARTALHQINR